LRDLLKDEIIIHGEKVRGHMAMKQRPADWPNKAKV
jgi:hypothetical protein